MSEIAATYSVPVQADAPTDPVAQPRPPEYRDPAMLVGRDVCPHCKRETDIYVVFCDGHVFETHRCRDHGDVCPMRSHIVNPLSVPAVRHD